MSMQEGEEIKCHCGAVLIRCTKLFLDQYQMRTIPEHFEYGNGEPIKGCDRVLRPCPKCGYVHDLYKRIRRFHKGD